MTVAKLRTVKMFRYAINFDGIDDTIEIQHSESLNIDENFTIIAWMQTNTNMSGPCCFTHNIFRKAGDYRFITMGIANNTVIYFLAQDEAGNRLNPRGPTPSDNLVKNRKWHHIAAVKDGINAYLYYDGELFSSDSNPDFGSISNTANIAIGPGYSGLIGEIKVYNHVLTADEIYLLYNHENITNGIVLWLRPHLDYIKDIDNDEILELIDLSGHENHGKIYGATPRDFYRLERPAKSPLRLAPALR